MCGGSASVDYEPTRIAGLSPRVRGKPPGIASTLPASRSIPACAGEADAAVRFLHQPPFAPVYPRVCGGSRGMLAVMPPP